MKNNIQKKTHEECDLKLRNKLPKVSKIWTYIYI